MNVLSLFLLRNWNLSHQYQPLQRILRVDAFLWSPIKLKEESKYDKNIVRNNKSTYGPLPNQNVNADIIECRKFFIILNGVLYLLDNEKVDLIKTYQDVKQFDANHNMSKEEIFDVAQSTFYTEQYELLENSPLVKGVSQYERRLVKMRKEEKIKIPNSGTPINTEYEGTDPDNFDARKILKIFYSNGGEDWFNIIGSKLEQSLYWPKWKTSILINILKLQINVKKLFAKTDRQIIDSL